MDQTTTTAPRKTLDDLAHLAVTDPTKLQPTDVTRLGDFYLDHEQHVMFHRRIAGAVYQRPAPNGSLGRRLDGIADAAKLPAPAAPAVSEPLADPLAGHAELGTSDLHATAEDEPPAA